MKRLIFSLLFLSLLTLCASGQNHISKVEKHSIIHQGMERTFWLYIPENLSDYSPLMFVLHGYGGSAEGYVPEMLTTADKHGFAVCYPQGAEDRKGKNCWNVGYPFQDGLKTDDVDFICHLSHHLQEKHGFNKNNIFLSGMSNGGEMCYLMALLRPEEFAAFAPIAGLTMEWSYKKYSPQKAVPLMEVHGTKDEISLWEGDPSNAGGWGEYISVPHAVGIWAAEARCTHTQIKQLPTKRKKVILHRHLGGNPAWEGGPEIEVRLYEIIEGGHSWGFNDMDTCEEIWKFFSIYLR